MNSISKIYHLIEDGWAMYYKEESGGIELIDMHGDYVEYIRVRNTRYDEIKEMVKEGLQELPDKFTSQNAMEDEPKGGDL